MLTDNTYQKNDTFNFIRLVFLGSLMKQSGRFVYSYISARLLGPNLYGLWNGIRLVIDYGVYANLGTLYTMERQIPFLKGRGDHTKINYIESICFIVNFIGTLFVCAVSFAISIYFKNKTDFSVSMIMVALIFFPLSLSTFYQYHIRANQLFPQLAKISLFDFIGSIIAVPLIFLFHYYGFLAGHLFRAIIILIVASKYSSLTLNLQITRYWDNKILADILKFGLPIMLAGLLSIAYQSIDRIVILSYLNTTQLGFYSLSAIVIIPLSLLNRSIVSVIYPKMSESYGSYGLNIENAQLRSLIMDPPYAISISFCIVIGYLHMALSLLVLLFLPQYREGISAATILIYALFFSFIYVNYVNFLTSVGKQIKYLVIISCMFPIKLALSIVFLKKGYSINGVATACLITEYLTYCVLTSISLKITHVLPTLIIKEIGLITGRITYIALVCYIIQKILPLNLTELTWTSDFKNILIQQICLTCSLIPFFIPFYRFMEKHNILKSFN